MLIVIENMNAVALFAILVHNLFYSRTHASCLQWMSGVVLRSVNSQIHSSVKYTLLGQTDICDASNQLSCTYPQLIVFGWYVELTRLRHTTPDICCIHRHLFSCYSGRIHINNTYEYSHYSYIVDDYYDSLLEWTQVDKLDCDQCSMSEAWELCNADQGQVQVCRRTAGDSCDGGIRNNSLSWYKFVNTHLCHHSRQLYNRHLTAHGIHSRTKFRGHMVSLWCSFVHTVVRL